MKQNCMITASVHDLSHDHSFNGVDLVKFVCAFLVCFIHIPPFQTDLLGLEFLNFWIKESFCRIAVPFFFVSSGFLLFRKIEIDSLDKNRIKSFVFKNLRLLGTWFALSFLGGRGQLWFIGALVMAVLVLRVLLKTGLKLWHIGILAVACYVFGMLGTSYHSVLEPLKAYWIPKAIILGYERIFQTTRNGVFFGFVFVFIGALFAQKRIVLHKLTAVFGFVVSFVLLFGEVYLLHRFDQSQSEHENDMDLFLLPVVFFLFYLASHINLKNRPIYGRMRAVGILIYFMHMFVQNLVRIGIDVALHFFRVDLTLCHCLVSICLTVVLAVFIERLSETKRFCWLRYLYT